MLLKQWWFLSKGGGGDDSFDVGHTAQHGNFAHKHPHRTQKYVRRVDKVLCPVVTSRNGWASGEMHFFLSRMHLRAGCLYSFAIVVLRTL